MKTKELKLDCIACFVGYFVGRDERLFQLSVQAGRAVHAGRDADEAEMLLQALIDEAWAHYRRERRSMGEWDREPYKRSLADLAGLCGRKPL